MYDDDTAATDSLAPAHERSPLASLRARRDKAQASLTKDLKVPRWDLDGGNEVFVRYRPLSWGEIDAARKRGEKNKAPDSAVVTNANLLTKACLGVYEVVDGEAVSIDPEDRDGTPPVFDERLGELLEVDGKRAVNVVRALFFTDGDVLAVAGKLAEWSGFSNDELDREYSGN